MLSFFWDFVCKLETRAEEGYHAGFCKHGKTMNLEGKRDRSLAYWYFSVASKGSLGVKAQRISISLTSPWMGREKNGEVSIH